ncbi:putative membrane protein [Clostridium pascui]|uniref:SHOCT domain-containing protein n=1 Tax=Clostridium pascui TaxID=46609 RepID=UPI00195A63F8|nr:SHOCT domain-containing protein [Clostridium pascui]MBM7869142.1 putative membrane protein [Clostridium pascui]
MFCGGFGGYGIGSSGTIGLGWMLLSMGFRLIIFVGMIVLIFKLFKSYNNKSSNAIKILNEKFANGEISEEEYLKRRTILSQKN